MQEPDGSTLEEIIPSSRMAKADRAAVLVDAASETAARDLAHSSAPWGAVDVRNWSATTVAATAALPGGRDAIWFEGMCASMLGTTRGGSAI